MKGRPTERDGLEGGSIGPEVADRVVWLSGRSSGRHAALSPGQRELLGAAEAHGFEVVEAGFPFTEGNLPWSPTNLVTASARNAAQYAALRWHAPAAARITEQLAPLFVRTRERLLVVCGSLGLELLGTALSALPTRPDDPRLRVVALGPVCRTQPDGLELTVAQGTRDLVSRLGYRGPVQLRPRCGHLGYLQQAEVRELVARAAGEAW